MAISRISFASAAATTVTPGSHAVGDLLLAFAYRDGSTTSPTIPAGWTAIDNTGSNSNSASCAFKWATSTSETSGTWSNASALAIVVYRGVSAVGSGGMDGGSGSTLSYYYPGSTLQTRNDNTSWLVRMGGHRSATNITSGTPSTEPDTYIGGVANNIAVFDTDGPITGLGTTGTQSVNASSGWRTYTLELHEESSTTTASQSDDFTGGTIDGAVFNAFAIGTGATVSASTPTSGQCYIYGGTGSSAFAYLNSVNQASLRNSELVWQVKGTPVNGCGAGISTLTNLLNAYATPNFGFYYNGSTTYPVVAGSVVYSTNWTAVADSWYRLRHVGSTVYWDTSTDGASWTNRLSVVDTDSSMHGWSTGYQVYIAYLTGAFYVDNINSAGGLAGTAGSQLQRALFAGSGSQTQTGTVAAILRRATAALTGSQTQTGTVAAQAKAATMSAGGVMQPSGTVSVGIPASTFDATGSMFTAVSIAASLQPALLDGDGGLTDAIRGRLLGATAELSGTQEITGEIAAFLTTLVLDGLGGPTGFGALIQTPTAELHAFVPVMGSLGAALADLLFGALSFMRTPTTLISTVSADNRTAAIGASGRTGIVNPGVIRR